MARLWYVALIGGLALCADLAGQDLKISAPPPQRPPVQIWIDPAQGQLQPIQLKAVSIDIRAQGFVASTRVDLTFFNPNARVLEGELVFPLASGQSITGYALEVDGKLRQGVVVEKETARVAFETTIRRGIDPGLAELTRGNMFRTRLYPLPANGSKRVALSFDQPLIDRGSAYRYVLPLQFGAKIGDFKVHAEAIRAEHAPQQVAADAPLSFERWRDSFVADLARQDFQPSAELAFDLPKTKATVTAFALPDALEPEWRHFAAQVQSAPPANLAAAAAPRRLALFYDASGSAATRNRQRELDFLAQWLQGFEQLEVDLIAFRNDADPAQHFSLRQGDSAALRAAIAALPLDGGSSYGAIRLEPQAKPDLVMVIGDGLSNFATHEPDLRLSSGAYPPLVVVHAASSVDSAALARLAQRHGGQLVNLLETDTAAALRQLAAPRWMLRSARVVQGECADLAPAAPQPVAATFSLYGRCRGSAEIDLEFGSGSGATLTRTIKLADANMLDAERGAFIGRLWAVARIADLDNAAAPDEAAITALAKRYGVVTRNTSMLVLDRIEDYVRYKVEPREPELLAQYRQALAAQPKETPEAQQRAQHLARVRAQWQEFRQWHAARHPWLESLLSTSAEAELARWRGLGQRAETAKPVAAAQALVEQARAVQQRWSLEGADPASRKAWEHEAATLMLNIDQLRKQRLKLAPDSDQIASSASRPEAPAAMADRAMTATAHAGAPPPPRPAPTPEPALAATEQEATKDAAPMESAAIGGALRKRANSDSDDLKSDAAGPATTANASIELQAWDPQTPYIARLRAATDAYAAYLIERKTQAATPAFFLDCADYFRNEAKNPRIALRVLSNLAEIDFESAPLLRVLAYRLQQWQRFDLAVPLFEVALKLRGEEPQSRRDLALALSRQPQADYRRAVELLWEVVSREWDGRFPEIQIIALHELNDVLTRMPPAARNALQPALDQWVGDKQLLEPIPVGLRVVLSWDADNTDVDLWVIDPAGDTAIYSQPRTRTGGHMSRDFTGGYGPEVFSIRRALPGTYVVKAHYFGDRQQKLTGAATLQAEFLTQFNSGASKREAVTRRLEGDEDVIEIGSFTVGVE